jgi:hypothetical protein
MRGDAVAQQFTNGLISATASPAVRNALLSSSAVKVTHCPFQIVPVPEE